jgi:hypothetical protein
MRLDERETAAGDTALGRTQPEHVGSTKGAIVPDYLSKSEIAEELAGRGLGGKRQISNILDGLADLAAEETALGEDFVIPGIVKIGWAYRPPKGKGERWKKGDEVQGFGGITNVKDTDSPAQKATVKLRPTLMGKVRGNKVSPKSTGTFLRSKAGKNVVARKA